MENHTHQQSNMKIRECETLSHSPKTKPVIFNSSPWLNPFQCSWNHSQQSWLHSGHFPSQSHGQDQNGTSKPVMHVNCVFTYFKKEKLFPMTDGLCSRENFWLMEQHTLVQWKFPAFRDWWFLFFDWLMLRRRDCWKKAELTFWLWNTRCTVVQSCDWMSYSPPKDGPWSNKKNKSLFFLIWERQNSTVSSFC